MKKNTILLLLVSGVLVNFVLMNYAEASWWNKGTNLLKSLSADPKISPSTLTGSEVSAAFKEALNIGAANVVQRLGSSEGFNADPLIRITLPSELNVVRNVLSKIGMAGMVDDLEMKLNRAAEKATPRAKALFVESINSMTFDDVMTIYNGPKDSATNYFRSKMSKSLRNEMRPTINQTLSQVGVVQVYDNIMGRYKEVPFVPDVETDLTEHVLTKGLDGIFFYIAREEIAIRENPAKQTSKLLKKVFGIGL